MHCVRWIAYLVVAVSFVPEARPEPRAKAKPVQAQYLQQLVALLPDSPGGTRTAAVDPRTAEGHLLDKPDAHADLRAVSPRPKAMPRTVGTLVGKVTGGGSDAYVYVEDIVAPATGSATMTQEHKQFAPRVLAVQKGMRVEFPNLDAVFHNVFSVTPDNSFDLGSYHQGASKSVTMAKPGVVTVYCNMHPQMVEYILVVPSKLYVHVGQDGFYRIPNVPAGHHRVVAWAPNAKPVTLETDIGDMDSATLEFELKPGHAGPHTSKEGMAYGSYN
jgi:plastocyanin